MAVERRGAPVELFVEEVADGLEQTADVVVLAVRILVLLARYRAEQVVLALQLRMLVLQLDVLVAQQRQVLLQLVYFHFCCCFYNFKLFFFLYTDQSFSHSRFRVQLPSVILRDCVGDSADGQVYLCVCVCV